MKAEHRKELETNILREQLTKVFARGKGTSKTVWGALGLIVLLGVLYWWWTSRVADRITVAWMDYYNARGDDASPLIFGPDRMEQVEKTHSGTAVVRAAHLTRADDLYLQGFQALVSRMPGRDGANKLDEAEKLYLDVLEKSANTPDLQLRATVGVAKCAEAKGDLNRAVFYYKEVEERFDKTLRAPDGVTQHPLVAEAAKRQKELSEAGDVASFYKGWPERLPKSEILPPAK